MSETERRMTTIDLMSAYHSGDAGTFEQLVTNNLGLVYRVAKSSGVSHRMPYEDRVQEGCIGLINAIRQFDPDRGVALSTFAYRAIKNQIYRATRQQTHIVQPPNHAFTVKRELNAAIERFNGDIDKAVAYVRATTKTTASHKLIKHIASSWPTTGSLDYQWEQQDGFHPYDRLADPHDQYAELDRQDTTNRLQTAIATVLSDAEKSVIAARYSEDVPLTYRELAPVLGMSHQSVANTEKRALAKLGTLINEQEATDE